MSAGGVASSDRQYLRAKAMRLLVNAAFDTRVDVGISLYIRRLVPRLAERCELTVLALDPEVFRPYGDVVAIPGQTRFAARRLAWTLACLGRYVTKEHDVLLCPTPALPAAELLPTVAVVHDLTPMEMHGLVSVKDRLLFYAGMQTLRNAWHIVTDSRHTRDDLLRRRLLAPGRVSVAYCGPGVPVSERRTDFGRHLHPFILTVGGHARHKNLRRLIAAFSRLKYRPDLRLVVVGDGSRDQLVRTTQAVEQHGLQSRVTMLSRIPDSQMSDLYRHCTILVHPSLYEGFGLPVLEAMAHGAPVACSSSSSLPEVAGNAAILFDPRSIDDITAGLQSLLDDDRLRAGLSESGRKQANRFSWDLTAETIYQRAAELT